MELKTFLSFNKLIFHRETTVAVYGFATLGMLAFTFTLGLGSRILVYATSTFVG
jgi:hypothetical protein